MQEDLSVLGASPLEVKITFPPATVIPTLMPQITPQPTSSPIGSMPTAAFNLDPKVEDALIINLEHSIGPTKIDPGSTITWRFQPAQALDHREVKSLSVWLISSDTNQRLPNQFLLWNFRTNMWDNIDNPKWGENQVGNQNELVSQDGDVIIYFANTDKTMDIFIDKFGITLVFQRADGSIEVHGFTP
jgi:hypothetical protein